MYELENVHKVYNEIANHFSETRHSPWPQVNEFIQAFEKGSVLVDIGCGNGKYLQSNRDIFEVSEEYSIHFPLFLVKISIFLQKMEKYKNVVFKTFWILFKKYGFC